MVVEDNKATKPWRRDVARAAKRLPPAGFGQAIGVEVTITLERPKTVTRTHPTASRGGGDVDKLARTILDALQDAGTFPDDAVVVELTVRKSYPDGPLPDALPYPGALIRVYPIGD